MGLTTKPSTVLKDKSESGPLWKHSVEHHNAREDVVYTMKVMRNHPTALTRQIKESGIGQEIGQYPQELKGGVKFRVEMRKRREKVESKWSHGLSHCPSQIQAQAQACDLKILLRYSREPREPRGEW